MLRAVRRRSKRAAFVPAMKGARSHVSFPPRAGAIPAIVNSTSSTADHPIADRERELRMAEIEIDRVLRHEQALQIDRRAESRRQNLDRRLLAERSAAKRARRSARGQAAISSPGAINSPYSDSMSRFSARSMRSIPMSAATPGATDRPPPSRTAVKRTESPPAGSVRRADFDAAARPAHRADAARRGRTSDPRQIRRGASAGAFSIGRETVRTSTLTVALSDPIRGRVSA